jgi:hypothetical protein
LDDAEQWRSSERDGGKLLHSKAFDPGIQGFGLAKRKIRLSRKGMLDQQ